MQEGIYTLSGKEGVGVNGTGCSSIPGTQHRILPATRPKLDWHTILNAFLIEKCCCRYTREVQNLDVLNSK